MGPAFETSREWIAFYEQQEEWEREGQARAEAEAERDVMPCQPGERLSQHDCPNQCGAQLIMLMVDRVYYCRRCEQEFEFSEIDP